MQEFRIFAVEIAMLLFAIGIVIKLCYIQLWERSKYQAMARKQYILEIPLEAQRGLIYDRNHNPLVLNEPCISVGLDKRQMEGTSLQYAAKLAPVLGVSKEWLRNRIRSVKGQFVWLRRRMDVELSSRISDLNLPGVRLARESRRVYPHHEVAAHVLGFTDVDNRGIEGVELKFNHVLAGKDGYVMIQRDGLGRAVPENIIKKEEPIDGKNLVLTIDYILQTIATEELRNAIDLYHARSGTVIILDPQTGEVLAMVNEPAYNPGDAGRYSFDARRNRAVTDAFEPGSTFKIVPFAALLEHHLTRPDALVFCENGLLELNGRRIRDAEPHAWLSVADVLAFSSNIGTVKLAQELGERRLYQTARRFGFGEETGIQLPGETPGILRPTSRWSSFTLASMAIGQEIACSALQMAMAYATVANGGLLLKPRIARAVTEAEFRPVERFERKVVRRVMPQETAGLLSRLLERVVEKGTGKSARIDGLRIAGKTGTAQKPLPDGRGYSKNEFVSSFVGFFPADRPRYLVLVKLDTDAKNQWGSKAAAPTFRRIAQKIVDYDRSLQGGEAKFPRKNGVPQAPLTLNIDGVVVPDLTNRKLTIARSILEALSLKVRCEGRGDFVVAQSPVPGTPLDRGQEVVLQLFEVEVTDGYLEMPSVIGLSLREALSRLAVAGLDPVVYGHGKVVRQRPEPGARVRAGIRCVVEAEPQMRLPELVKIGYEDR